MPIVPGVFRVAAVQSKSISAAQLEAAMTATMTLDPEFVVIEYRNQAAVVRVTYEVTHRNDVPRVN
jgi:hypothetical protein